MGRHDRQARLVEVGFAGQERIAAATVEIRTEGLAAEVATRYLAGAGVGRLYVRERALGVVATSIDPAVRAIVDEAAATSTTGDEFTFQFRDPSAREAAHGALEALRALRGIVLGGGGRT